METLQRDHWSARKSLLVLFGDWGIATAAFVLAYSMHHYNGDSIIPGLVSVAAITISAVSFVGAPIVVVRRSGQSRWLFAFFVSGVLIGGFLLGCAEYHHVRSAHALAKIQKAFGAAEQVTKTTPPPQLSDLPPYQANPEAWQAARAKAVSTYLHALDRAAPSLARMDIKILGVLSDEPVPRIDMRVGTIAFCYTPNLVQANAPGLLTTVLGTCEQPDWDTMVRGLGSD